MWGYAALAGYQIISGLQQADIVAQQAGLQKQIDEFNAELLEYDAWKLDGYAQTAVARQQGQYDQVEASGKVRAAAAGVDTQSGSMADVVQDNEMNMFLNAMDLENQIQEQASGYRRQARGTRLQSGINYQANMTRSSSMKAGVIAQGAGTLVGGYYKSGAPSLIGGESGYGSATPLTADSNTSVPFRVQQNVLMMP